MRHNQLTLAAIAATLSLLPLTACELDVPDLNNPGIDDLAEHPTRSTVRAACVGLQIGSRRNRAQANGYIAQLAILGREAYNFDVADPRLVGELLEGPLQPGSPFGGNFWTLPYANIKLANLVQGAVDKVADFSDAERAAILGFSKTVEATDLLEVVVTHDTNGGVIDTDREFEEGLGAMVGKDEMYAEIAKLLDEGARDLAMGGDAFPFFVSTGFKDIATGLEDTVLPADYLKYNRAMRARVAAYMKDYATVITALEASFIDDTMLTVAKLQRGVYLTFSNNQGETPNNLINDNIYTHPSFMADAQKNGLNLDQRFTRKTRVVDGTKDDPTGSGGGLSSNLKYTVYARSSAPVPLIRNEELILLRAEAKFFGTPSDPAGATADLNLVRTVSGSLQIYIADLVDPTMFTTALLYERRYSLAFEGHRWIDARRFDRMMDIPLDKPAPDHVRNVRYPIPQAECDARPGEPRCSLGSQDE
jgi:starch-binding outer membrane protein, SusD/RagB family